MRTNSSRPVEYGVSQATGDDSSPLVPPGPRRDLIQLVRQIQTLALELNVRQPGEDNRKLHAKERALERLRWRLAVLARRVATDPRSAG
jgi:hypothetical protein